MAVIRRFARQIGERFRPDQVILFGSYAYGRPRQGSDVDLLVVMPAADQVNQAIRISLTFEPPFPLDLIVRTPEKLRRGLDEGDWFLREIVAKGKILYAKANGALGPEGRGGPRKPARTVSGRGCASPG